MIRAGIFGLGRIGHGFGTASSGDPLCHSESYARVPSVVLALGVDPDGAARARFATRFPGAVVAAEAPAGTEPIIDVASIATPAPARAASVDAALRSGARVILAEKPLAPSTVEAAAIAARCREAGAILLVNYSRRWTPMLHALRTAVRSDGALGPPLGASIRFTGGLVHNGTHWIDLLAAVLGPPASSRREDGQLTLRFVTGCTARLTELTDVGWSGGEGEFWSARGMLRFAASGQRVTFQARCPSAWNGFAALGPERHLVPPGEGLRGHLLGAVREAVRLASAERPGRPTCGAEEALHALAIAEQAEAAS
ncbi:MAG: Gfo/Idh/MocA family oxidoreductase [Verrucomicrobiota bacterium]